jgi:3-hydroxyisobutyrate dehydrogenase-like beta-hydroxyacid dehydrogenase
MLRSIFSKGLEALIIEFLVAGQKPGLKQDLWQEVATLMTERGFEDVASNWVCSHGVAHERRYHEMNQVIDLLKDMQLDPIMTEATSRFFKRSTDLRLSQDFAGKPELMDDVIETLLRRTSPGHS